MSKHTPGPWMIDDLDGEFGLQIIVSDKTGIATACYGRGRETDLANAALIAAAPDLLLAAKRLVAAMDDYDGDVPSSIDSPYARMQDAIAKAEGNA